MGIFKGKFSCNNVNTDSGNPNPFKYKITKKYEGVYYTLLFIVYPDCTNFKGEKILIYKNEDLKRIKDNSMDPHFLEDKPSPILRIHPKYHDFARKLYAFLEFLQVSKNCKE